MPKLRSPICTFVGHVDHGKSSILDKIRGTAVVQAEAGGMTQAIGASIIPLETIKRICGRLLERLRIELTIPGLLFIDTPGHAAFKALRRRGGNLADLAVLVVDINEGVMPQTAESVEILKSYRTPFVVAANKLDLLKDWDPSPELALTEDIAAQSAVALAELETKLYKLAAALGELGFKAERFDRVEDYAKQLAVVPCSAKSGEGIPELLMVLVGLAQRFLAGKLELTAPNARGTVLEIKEERGLGKTMDVILYDGSLAVNDMLVIGGLERPIVTKVRALFQPLPLIEMRERKAKFNSVRELSAATGLKIAAPGIDEVVAGMPLASATAETLEKIKAEIQAEVEEVLIKVDAEGVVIKADSLGSLEALNSLLHEKGIKVKAASIGAITKKDIAEAEANLESAPLDAVVLGFNVLPELRELPKVKVITSNIIYRLIDELDGWRESERARLEAKALAGLARPFKLLALPGYVFRQSKPAVLGCEVLGGKARPGLALLKEDGRVLPAIKAMEFEGQAISEAAKGQRVAVSIAGVTVGRQLKEGDVLYSAIPEEQFRELKKLKAQLSAEELELLREIAEIMRRASPLWGV